MPPSESLATMPLPRRKSLRSQKPVGSLKDDLPMEVINHRYAHRRHHTYNDYHLVGACYHWHGGGAETAGGLEPQRRL